MPIEIQVMKLDTYGDEHGIREVALLKVDTEGMKVDVLDGAQSVLARCPKSHRRHIVRHGIRLRWIASRMEGSGLMPKKERDGRE